MATQILDGATANGSSNEVPVNGRGTFYAFGTWDTATLTLEFSVDGGTTWIAVSTDTTVTADAVVNFELYGAQLRATLSSVGGSTVIDAYIGS